MSKHQKHTNLERRKNDTFAPNELAVLGTNCKNIANLINKVSQKLSNYKLAYLDASHSKEIQKNTLSEFVFHPKGNLQITTVGTVNKFAQRLLFASFDCVFINGNHYRGTKQILILDKAKETSVLKRINQLDNLQFVIKLTEDTEYFSSLEQKYPQIKKLPCYTIDKIDSIANHIECLIQKSIAPIKGLVLIGGKSIRMKTDKSKLNYYGKPQKEIAKKTLENNNLETFYSVEKPSENKDEIYDKFLNLGSFGGICSAFQKDPNVAWLVLATDVPFVKDKIIKLLLQKRNPSKVATVIKGKSKEFVEPLIAIYEPKAYSILLQYLVQGYACPRKMLINTDIEIVEVEDYFIRNINTPKEFERAKKEINKENI